MKVGQIDYEDFFPLTDPPLHFHSNHTDITWAETKEEGLADKYLPGECIKEFINELKFLVSAAVF